MLREQRKVPGSLSDGRVPLTRKARRLRSFLKEKRGRSLKILDIVGSALSILRLRVIIGYFITFYLRRSLKHRRSFY